MRLLHNWRLFQKDSVKHSKIFLCTRCNKKEKATSGAMLTKYCKFKRIKRCGQLCKQGCSRVFDPDKHIYFLGKIDGGYTKCPYCGLIQVRLIKHG